MGHLDLAGILFIAGMVFFILFPMLWIGINGDRMVFHQGEPKGVIEANGSAEDGIQCGEVEGMAMAREVIRMMQEKGEW